MLTVVNDSGQRVVFSLVNVEKNAEPDSSSLSPGRFPLECPPFGYLGPGDKAVLNRFKATRVPGHDTFFVLSEIKPAGKGNVDDDRYPRVVETHLISIWKMTERNLKILLTDDWQLNTSVLFRLLRNAARKNSSDPDRSGQADNSQAGTPEE